MRVRNTTGFQFPGMNWRLIARNCVFALLVLSLLATSGCSALRLGYGFLDNLVQSYIKDVFPFDRQERRLLAQHVDEFHQWHQCQELPRYSQFLSRVSSAVERPLDEHDLQLYVVEMEQAWQRIAYQVQPYAAELLAGLSDEQLRGIEKNLARLHRKTVEENTALAPEKYYSQRTKAMAGRLADWVGRLTPQQRQRVAQWGEALHDLRPWYIQSERDWQQRLQHALRHGQEAEGYSLVANAWLELTLEADHYWAETQILGWQHNQQATFELLLDVHKSLSDKQRRRLQKTLQGYIDDFTYLAGKTRCQHYVQADIRLE